MVGKGSQLGCAKRPSNQATPEPGRPQPREHELLQTRGFSGERKRLPTRASQLAEAFLTLPEDEGRDLGSPRIEGAPGIHYTRRTAALPSTTPTRFRRNGGSPGILSQNSLALPARSGSAPRHIAPGYTPQSARNKQGRNHASPPNPSTPPPKNNYF